MQRKFVGKLLHAMIYKFKSRDGPGLLEEEYNEVKITLSKFSYLKSKILGWKCYGLSAIISLFIIGLLIFTYFTNKSKDYFNGE